MWAPPSRQSYAHVGHHLGMLTGLGLMKLNVSDGWLTRWEKKRVLAYAEEPTKSESACGLQRQADGFQKYYLSTKG